MDSGAADSATRLAWRSVPELLINEESLVDVIAKLRAQVQTLERNELLSGTALPPWLLRALTDVANNVDAVVGCQAMHEQVNGLQKEVLELRHELLLQQSATSSKTSSSIGYNPTPHHRLSTGSSARGGGAHRAPSAAKSIGHAGADAIMEATGAAATAVAFAADAEQLNLEQALKPVWDAIHKQTNQFSALKQNFNEAKETVLRLQSEIKRRDAVVQARNAKHESVVQSQVEKINEAMRACVTRNDLIAVEQRIAQQMKTDKLHVLEEVDTRSNKILEDLLASRAEQEDFNSQTAEHMEGVARKHARMEEHVIELMKKYTEGQVKINEMRATLSDAVAKVESTSSTMDVFQDKVASFEETQGFIRHLTEKVEIEKAESERIRLEQDDNIVERISESAKTLRGEIGAVNAVVTELVEMSLDCEIKALAAKLDVVQLTVTDATRKFTTQQKQLTTHEDHTKTQFTQVFDSLDRLLSNVSTISEESMGLSYNLNQAVEQASTLQREVTKYKESTDKMLNLLHRTTQELQSGHDKHVKTTETEIVVIKNQLFHVEDAQSNLRSDLETTQRDVDQNLRSQITENKQFNGSLDTLFQARDDQIARQDAAQAQMMAMQADNRNEIQQATIKLVAIVDKESDRVEALYRSFQEKQDHFADAVARSSIRNMDLPDMNRELDRICEIFISECWKFETSARASTKSSARDKNQTSGGGVAAATTRKLFNERQQQLLAKNCQFFADLVVARAEYEVLHSGCNKEPKSQADLEELMLDVQASISEKMRIKIQTKIKNNKNIGEQFDKSTLDRRELFIETLGNILEASVRRRTMRGAGGASGIRSGARQSVVDDISPDDPTVAGSSYLEKQRPVGTSSALPGSRRQSSSRKLSAMEVLGSPALSRDLDANRVSFSPGSAPVYRAGFRLPKATQSPPNSPGGSSLSPALSSASLLGGLRLGSAALSESGEPPLFLSSTFDMDTSPASDAMQGWSGVEVNGDGLAKSISLPVLR